ncbi:hypothetical protein BGZ76_008776 [Entomortierella beljakovae]|nr:hypothetical protein BGZ76_008776 [Entomortierella beljakovae]
MSSTPISVSTATEVSDLKTLAISTEDNYPISPDKANHAPSLSAIKNIRKDYSSPRSGSGSSLVSQASTIRLCRELVPEYITLRLRSVTCTGIHDKTQVRLKLQSITKHTKPAKALSEHTHQSFDFYTTVHNMTFDTVKIDVYDIKAFNHQSKIGRAYLSLHDLQKKVGNAYDNDGDDNTEPEQSVRSSLFDTANFCKKHDDVFDLELPLFKHGSYSKFRHERRLPRENKHSDIITKGSDNGKDFSTIIHDRPLPRSESFAQLALNGVEVGKITVQATLHFPDQTQNPMFLDMGNEPQNDDVMTMSEYSKRPVYQNTRSDTESSVLSSSSSQSSFIEDTHNGSSVPINIPHRPQEERHPSGRVLQMPSSPPNLSVRQGHPMTPPLSPTLSQGSSSSPHRSFQWVSDGTVPQNSMMYWEGNANGRSNENNDSSSNESDNVSNDVNKDHVKGEDIEDTDRRREEELMASIKANGSKEKKDMYLKEGKEGKKGKKHKFSLVPEQTKSAFNDIKHVYSSFFGHGWNLSKREFLKGFHIVEEFYARHPTPTTNKAFDNIEVLEKSRHFVRLAIASYGSLPWVYFGYSFKVAPLNFVRFNSDRKNVMDYFKLKKEDMIMWHFDKRTALVPSYYIIREPKYNALCIIIRGTFSITDAMTDLVCEYYPYKDGLVHKGIMDNARFILEHSGKDIEAALKKFNLNTIYCIGHSLGAGSASLLCSLLQDHFADYRIPATPESAERKLDVYGYLFAPPPVCTVNLAVQWERTQIAFINENDIVTRLSYGNALDLKELIKIAAIESENPIYKGVSNDEKMSRILKVLEKAQEALRAVDDVPRLVTGGTVAYMHKVYDDTPVIQNKSHDRSSKFGLPEDWSEGMEGMEGHSGRKRSPSSASGSSSISRSLSAISSALNPKSHRKISVSTVNSDSRGGTMMKDPGNKTPVVTPYRPSQLPVHLEDAEILPSLDAREKDQHPNDSVDKEEDEIPVVKTSGLGEAIQFGGPSNARDLATQRILNDTERDDISVTVETTDSSNRVEYEKSEDSDDHKVYTTKKPRKHGSKKKEIRIEFSDRENFMAIPLRNNWLWHHFPQQYDSRVERSLDWAKAQKEKIDKKQRLREQREGSK